MEVGLLAFHHLNKPHQAMPLAKMCMTSTNPPLLISLEGGGISRDVGNMARYEFKWWSLTGLIKIFFFIFLNIITQVEIPRPSYTFWGNKRWIYAHNKHTCPFRCENIERTRRWGQSVGNTLWSCVWCDVWQPLCGLWIHLLEITVCKKNK